METATVPYQTTRADHPRVERLLIVSPNWLGDAVMALPAIADVRRALPVAWIAVAARASVADLYRLAPGIDHIADARAALPAADGVLLLTNSFQSALGAWRAGITERWGYRRDFRGPLLTRAVHPPEAVHQIEYYQWLTRRLGFPSGPADPQISVSEGNRQAGADLLRARGWDGAARLAAVAPGAAYGNAKRWPADRFADVVGALRQNGVAPVLIGGPADRAATSEVARLAGGRAIDLAGATDLPTLGGVLVHCRALVTNDSGAMHFAAAAGVPIVAIFGPTNERATEPRGAPHVVITHHVWCRPCMQRECPIDHRCMEGISSDRVLEAVGRWL